MTLKSIIKKIPGIKKLLVIRNIFVAKRYIRKDIGYYINSFLLHSSSYQDSNNPLKLRREIIIGTHILEKGLSHYNFRAGFGKENVIDLQNNIRKYLLSSCPDTFAIDNAMSLLNLYHEYNKKYNFDDSEYIDESLFIGREKKDLEPYVYDIKYNPKGEFRRIASVRHSVRVYDNKSMPISNEEILDAISIANTAPSACNRQATHVFVIGDKDTMLNIEKIHGGCKLFGRNAGAILIITSDLSLYSRTEVKMPLYDAGIYSMNLLYALQDKGLFSCILNGSFSGNALDRMYELTGISDRFAISGIIAVYKLNDLSHINIAKSPRRCPEDVTTFL